jgi:hypothetical protein
VGKRVQVFWPGDRKWFSGTITEYRQEDAKHRGACGLVAVVALVVFVREAAAAELEQQPHT